MRFKTYCILIFCSIFFSCQKDENIDDDKPLEYPENGILITNEGNFNWGNASISWYDFDKNEITNEVFKKQNNIDLGDVCQSAEFINDKWYIVVNNSSKIVVLNPTDFKIEKTITGFNSPRYIKQISENKCFVSDLYANKIWVLDLNSDEILTSIPVKGWSEEMIFYENKLYVTAPNSNFLYVIDVSENILIDSIDVDFGVNSIQSSGENFVLLSWGKSGVKPFIELLDVKTKSIPQKIELQIENPNKLRKLSDNEMFYINEHIWSLSVESSELSNQIFVENYGSQIFYGLGVDVKKEEIYVSDAKDYLQNSHCYRYSKNADLLDDFEAGIITGGFWFKP